jgi:predicted RNA-binding protein
MCESNLYVLEDNEERMVAKDVIYISLDEDGVTAVTLSGDKFEMKGYKVDRIDFMAHKILLVK